MKASLAPKRQPHVPEENSGSGVRLRHIFHGEGSVRTYVQLCREMGMELLAGQDGEVPGEGGSLTLA